MEPLQIKQNQLTTQYQQKMSTQQPKTKMLVLFNKYIKLLIIYNSHKKIGNDFSIIAFPT